MLLVAADCVSVVGAQRVLVKPGTSDFLKQSLSISSFVISLPIPLPREVHYSISRSYHTLGGRGIVFAVLHSYTFMLTVLLELYNYVCTTSDTPSAQYSFPTCIVWPFVCTYYISKEGGE